MEQHKIAEKAKLVESSPSADHSPETDISSSDSSSSDNPPSNDSAADATVNAKRSDLSHFPDINIERNAHEQSTTTARSLARFLNKPVPRIATMAMLVIVFGFLIADRSNKENNYRRLIDRAELDDLSGNYSQAIKSWKAAINQATDLGDGNKTLADLYYRLARDQAITEERSVKGNAAATQALEKAIALYESVPYTLPEQMRAKEDLLLTLPSESRLEELVSPWFETPESQKLLNQANVSIEKGQIAKAIVDFRNYVSQSNDPFCASQNVLVSTWKKLEVAIPAHSELSEKAMPLMLEVVFAEKCVAEPPYELDSIEELKKASREANLLVDRTIAKTGRDPHSFEALKALGLQLLHNKEYKAATVCYLRCLAMKEDPEAQKNIALCYAALHPSSLLAAERRLSVLNDLRALYTEGFGDSSGQVTKTLSQMATIYWETGELAQAEKLMKEVLERSRQDRTKNQSVRRNVALTEWNTPEFAYLELFKFYVLTGRPGKARDLYALAKKDTTLNTQYGDDLKEHFVRLCGKSNQMDDPLLKVQPRVQPHVEDKPDNNKPQFRRF
ncbi:MAG: hypothetical protein JST89_23480 [Cyanobacteria bacterium SZAS-4]|nr:hypothetical protein [Cyanobacteria bacterium SZAS-4]